MSERGKAGRFVPKEEAPAVEKVELLTVEAHPIDGRRERWRMSDGTVQDFHFTPVFQEKHG